METAFGFSIAFVSIPIEGYDSNYGREWQHGNGVLDWRFFFFFIRTHTRIARLDLVVYTPRIGEG